MSSDSLQDAETSYSKILLQKQASFLSLFF